MGLEITYRGTVLGADYEKALNDERRNRAYEQNLLGMVKLINLFTVRKKMVEQNGFMTTYPLSINFKFSLFMKKRRR